MQRWRAEEQVENLTMTLRSREFLPSSFHRLLDQGGIDPDETVLTDLLEDQGCCLVGTLLTSNGEIIRFDIDFDGNACGDWPAWGAILSINEWQRSHITVDRPKQGTPLDVARKMLRAGRL